MRDVRGWLSCAGFRGRPATLTLALALLPVVLLVVDALTPPDIRLGPLMVAAPTFAAVLCSTPCVILVCVVALTCAVVAAGVNAQLDTANFAVQIGTIALISVAAVAASAVRVRRERELAQSRWVAEVAQRVLLHPLPRRTGPFDLASLYMAADEEAAIGGDLYAATRNGPCARILLGDVQGKGLASLEMVSCVVNSFRQSVRHDSPLVEVVRELEATFVEDVEELSAAANADPRSGSPYGDEAFVTAVVLELPDEGPMRLANLGHPPPLLINEGTVAALEPTVPELPLGLGMLDGQEVMVDQADLPPGATLLLYTDGVTEARGPSGAFYPLAERLERWASLPPDALLAAVRGDLRDYVGARLADDVAMVAVRRSPARVAPPARADRRTRSDELTEARGAA
ncbi:PP2C family protein-serine/threonine phosphatase [Streptomyces sp. NPDC046831]|uniref:PP2C family protein-serine/threonine phosphatase n=1 Tax=Streptomyces sp. NPDC046831 TaxID=3154805 RepID=UPI0033EFF2E5